MVMTLSELVERTQGTAVPEWLRNQVVENREEITKALREGGSYTLEGPNGERVLIHAENSSLAAAL